MITLWVLAVLWIAGGAFTGSHSNVTTRWMGGVSLVLVAVACTILGLWLIQQITMEPYYTTERAFELGYQAGRIDALNERRPALSVVTALSSSTGQTGT